MVDIPKDELVPTMDKIQVCDIVVESTEITADKLAGIALWLLQQKEVKTYLDTMKQKKKLKSMSGVG